MQGQEAVSEASSEGYRSVLQTQHPMFPYWWTERETVLGVHQDPLGKGGSQNDFLMELPGSVCSFTNSLVHAGIPLTSYEVMCSAALRVWKWDLFDPQAVFAACLESSEQILGLRDTEKPHLACLSAQKQKEPLAETFPLTA